MHLFIRSHRRWIRRLTALILVLLGLVASSAGRAIAQSSSRYINPPGLVTPTGYSHVVVAPDGVTIYIAGQVATDSLGRLIGPGDLKKQLEQVYTNLRTALASVGGTLADLVKTTTYLTDMSQVAVVREVRGRFLDPTHPPANTLLGVASLARPELLVEIEAVAIVRQPVR